MKIKYQKKFKTPIAFIVKHLENNTDGYIQLSGTCMISVRCIEKFSKSVNQFSNSPKLPGLPSHILKVKISSPNIFLCGLTTPRL